MAAGVAPIAPARGSFPELVMDGDNGALFTPDDPDALARSLEDVDADPEKYLEFGRRGRTTYDKRFSRAANVDELVKIYEYAVGNPVGRHHVTP
jgi:glycosyltransferase involved in cell wall biosynthesis